MLSAGQVVNTFGIGSGVFTMGSAATGSGFMAVYNGMPTLQNNIIYNYENTFYTNPSMDNYISSQNSGASEPLVFDIGNTTSQIVPKIFSKPPQEEDELTTRFFAGGLSIGGWNIADAVMIKKWLERMGPNLQSEHISPDRLAFSAATNAGDVHNVRMMEDEGISHLFSKYSGVLDVMAGKSSDDPKDALEVLEETSKLFTSAGWADANIQELFHAIAENSEDIEDLKEAAQELAKTAEAMAKAGWNSEKQHEILMRIMHDGSSLSFEDLRNDTIRLLGAFESAGWPVDQQLKLTESINEGNIPETFEPLASFIEDLESHGIKQEKQHQYLSFFVSRLVFDEYEGLNRIIYKFQEANYTISEQLRYFEHLFKKQHGEIGNTFSNIARSMVFMTKGSVSSDLQIDLLTQAIFSAESNTSFIFAAGARLLIKLRQTGWSREKQRELMGGVKLRGEGDLENAYKTAVAIVQSFNLGKISVRGQYSRMEEILNEISR